MTPALDELFELFFHVSGEFTELHGLKIHEHFASQCAMGLVAGREIRKHGCQPLGRMRNVPQANDRMIVCSRGVSAFPAAQVLSCYLSSTSIYARHGEPVQGSFGESLRDACAAARLRLREIGPSLTLRDEGRRTERRSGWTGRVTVLESNARAEQGQRRNVFTFVENLCD